MEIRLACDGAGVTAKPELEEDSGEDGRHEDLRGVHKQMESKFSPTLADRLAGNSKEGISSLVRKIKEALEASPKPRRRAS